MNKMTKVLKEREQKIPLRFKLDLLKLLHATQKIEKMIEVRYDERLNKFFTNVGETYTEVDILNEIKYHLSDMPTISLHYSKVGFDQIDDDDDI